jgi:hypothetical protein
VLQPDELVVLIGFGKPHENELHHWVNANHQFTQQFATAFRQIANADAVDSKTAKSERQKLVKQELAQGRNTLVETDLSHASSADVALVHHMVNVAKQIEIIYAKQKGVFGLQPMIPPNDFASQMLFYRNQSPFCESPITRDKAACDALARSPEKISGLYPAAIQKDKHFCESLATSENAAQLMDHFSVVVNDKKPGSYKSIPYNIAYKKEMQIIATELEAAADALDESEAALKNYLRAAATSFRDNNWEPANRAWVAMNATNSKWYARIAPDEVYYETLCLESRLRVATSAYQYRVVGMATKAGAIKD